MMNSRFAPSLRVCVLASVSVFASACSMHNSAPAEVVMLGDRFYGRDGASHAPQPAARAVTTHAAATPRYAGPTPRTASTDHIPAASAVPANSVAARDLTPPAANAPAAVAAPAAKTTAQATNSAHYPSHMPFQIKSADELPPTTTELKEQPATKHAEAPPVPVIQKTEAADAAAQAALVALAAAEAAAAGGSPQESTPPAQAKVAEPTPAKEAKTVAAKPAEAKPAETAAATPLSWPVQGRILAGFNPERDETGSDGIRIATPEGTAVKAAASGEVVYVGSELKGYGNLIIVRHDNGYLTSYAHTRSASVKKGDKVNRGQAIAESGKTGNVTTPQLHFGVRKGRAPVDPLTLLPAGATSLNQANTPKRG